MRRSLRRCQSNFCSVDGVRVDASTANVSIWDQTFQRGDGIFDAMRVIPSKDGSRPHYPRALYLHLDRIQRSASGIRLPLPPRDTMASWLRAAAAAGGEGYLRVMVTRGTGPGYGDHLGLPAHDLAPPKVFVVWQPMPAPVESLRLYPMVAPWHPAGYSKEDWATVKWLSYGGNMHSARLAQEAGFDNALLLARGAGSEEEATISQHVAHTVLDGPNFAVMWTHPDNPSVLHTPCWRTLGMLQSTTLTMTIAAAQRAGVQVHEGRLPLQHAYGAEEFFALSTTRDLLPVAALGKHRMPTIAGPMQQLLTDALASLVLEMETDGDDGMKALGGAAAGEFISTATEAGGGSTGETTYK